MNKKSFLLIVILSALSSTFIPLNDAQACLSCGCGTSGALSDMGAMGGLSGIFSKNKSFLFQLGSSFRNINGSFNELGDWNSVPLDSHIFSLQHTASLMYFPDKNLSLGAQLPIVTNVLNQASWGNFGSISPTDIGSRAATSLGDISLQATYKAWEINDLALGAWLRTDFPTGRISGPSESLSGSGVLKASGGVFSIKKINKFEILANIGYQQPLALSENYISPFYAGNALLYQVQANYPLNMNLRLGGGVSGYIGNWASQNNKSSGISTKFKLLLSAQYDVTMYDGIGLGIAYDPRFGGLNSSTDTSLNLVFYHYL